MNLEKSKHGDGLRYEDMATDLSISVWNQLAHLPQFGHLNPKDFPVLYDIIHAELKRFLTHDDR